MPSPRGVPGPGCVCLVPGGYLVLGGVPGPGGVPGGDIPQMATAAGGTHPTGMHSCVAISFHNLFTLENREERKFCKILNSMF